VVGGEAEAVGDRAQNADGVHASGHEERAALSTAVGGTVDATYMTSVVTESGSGYSADPDALRQPSPWATDSSA